MSDGGSVLVAVLEVFTEISAWFGGFVQNVSQLFWTSGSGSEEGALTFMGVLAVAGLGFAVIFLVIGLISNFLHFRG